VKYVPGSFAALVLIAVASFAGEPPPGPAEGPVPVFPSAAELVQIDVVVAGADGAPVRDLRREDFEVLEDGRPQRISHFAVGTASRPATLPAAGPAGTPSPPGVPTSTRAPGRTIVLVFDDLHLGASRLSAAKVEAKRFLREDVGPRDQVALLTTSGIRGVFQPLTRDREAVVRAIDRVTLQDRSARSHFAGPYISEDQAEQIDRFGELASPEGNEAYDLAVAQFMAEYIIPRGVAEEMARERTRSILEEGARYTRASLSTLETTVRSLAPVPGRKIVLLVSEGFFLGRGTTHESGYDLRRITDAATRSGVVIYSLDALGLPLLTPGGDISEKFVNARMSVVVRGRVDRGQHEARREGLRAVAEESGGFAVLGGSIGSGLRRILDDNEAYYLLAYEPVSSRRAGRFRGIKVRLPRHPGLVARTRRGYFEPKGGAGSGTSRPSARDTVAEAQERVHHAFTSIVPLRGLPVSLAADFLDLPDSGPTVVVNVAVEVASLRLSEVGSRHRGAVEIVGLVTDREGSEAERFAERLQLDLRPETRDAVRRDGIGFSRRIALKPGLYQVRVAALGDGPDEIGSASRWVEVPDLAGGRLTLSSVFLDRTRGDGGEATPPPRGEPGAARRTFPAGSEVDIVLFAYNARPDDAGVADLAARFQIWSEGRLVHEFQPRPMRFDAPGAPQRVPGGGRLSLAGLPPGDYELHAVVEDRREGTIAERGVDFVVE